MGKYKAFGAAYERKYWIVYNRDGKPWVDADGAWKWLDYNKDTHELAWMMNPHTGGYYQWPALKVTSKVDPALVKPGYMIIERGGAELIVKAPEKTAYEIVKENIGMGEEGSLEWQCYMEKA